MAKVAYKLIYEKLISQYASYSSTYIICLAHYKQRTAWKASLQSTQLIWKVQKIHSWNMHSMSWCKKAIASQFQPRQTHYITAQVKNSLKSHAWAINSVLSLTLKPMQIITLRVVKSNGPQRRTKVYSTIMQAL